MYSGCNIWGDIAKISRRDNWSLWWGEGRSCSKDAKVAVATQGTMAMLSSAPMIHLFYNSSMIHGHIVYCLVGNGSTHNFINTRMVDRCGLQAQNFPEIDVTVANGLTLQCVKGIP